MLEKAVLCPLVCPQGQLETRDPARNLVPPLWQMMDLLMSHILWLLAEVMPTLLELMNSRRQAHVDHEVLLVSSPGYGVLDSGCGKTIIGENTLKQFQHLWRQAGISEPREQSESNFVLAMVRLRCHLGWSICP